MLRMVFVNLLKASRPSSTEIATRADSLRLCNKGKLRSPQRQMPLGVSDENWALESDCLAFHAVRVLAETEHVRA